MSSKRSLPIGQKGNAVIILAITILFILVAGAAYYLGTQKQPEIITPPASIPSIPPSISPLTIPSIVPKDREELISYQGDLFTFQYPQGWSIIEEHLGNVTLQKKQIMMIEGTEQEAEATITVRSADIQPGGNLDTWFEAQQQQNGNRDLFETIKQLSKQVTLSGQEAISYVVPGAGGYLDEGIITIGKGMGYHIFILGQEVTGGIEAYQAIVNSFQFTK